MDARVCEPGTSRLTNHRSADRIATRPLLVIRTIIERTVADVFDIDCEYLRTPTRGLAPVALARQVAMYIAHVSYAISLTEVGVMFNRDRTTVSHACEVVEKRRDDARFDQALDMIDLVVRVRIGPGTPGAHHMLM